jgi:rhodanese-related sulfurtransferase
VIHLLSESSPRIPHRHEVFILPVELKTLLSTGCCLIDVRESVEHAEEHIAGSKLIPLGQIERRISEFDRSQPFVITCRSGKRGAEAQRKLQSLGFTDARNLEGGLLAWKAAGLSVSRSGKNVLPLMQQVQLTIGLGVVAGVVLALTAHPNWLFLCAFFGAGLIFAGSTGWCGLAILTSKMPWNRMTCQSCLDSRN